MRNENKSKVRTLKLLGFTAAFAVTLVGFEWKQFEPEMLMFQTDYIAEIELETVPSIPKPKKPKKKKGHVVKKSTGTKLLLITDTENNHSSPEPLVIDTNIYEGDDPDDGFEAPIEKPYLVPDEPAEFPGGHQALFNYLSKNIKYPIDALEVGIEGKVHMRFVVGKDGTVRDVEVVRGIGGGCEEEAIRVLKRSPKWKPGVVDGKNVDSYFYLPVNFKTK